MRAHHLLEKAFPLLKEDIVKLEDFDVNHLTDSSKEIKENTIFICIKGHRVDGHDFIEEAINNGARLIISEKLLQVDTPTLVVKDTKLAISKLASFFYELPTTKLKLFGITGTNGKTTTTFLLESILKNQNLKTGLISTMYAKIHEKIIEVANTTPNSLVLQKLFSTMVEEGCEAAVMEVSSHSLDEGRILGCNYDVAIFTNLTQDHMDYHKTMLNYKQSKSLLFSQLGASLEKEKTKFAILNSDDEATEYYKRITSAHVYSYGINNPADFMAKDIELTSSHTKFLFCYPGGKQIVKSPLIGIFNIYNCLAAMAAAYSQGIAMEQIIYSIENIKPVKGRFESIECGQEFSVIVDYAHTPDSLENVLQTILQFAKSDVFCIIGCGGNRDKTKRPLMAQIACKYATHPIFTSDNPRLEDLKQILLDMEQGVKEQTYQVIENRKEAIRYAILRAKKEDIILIAGKGHETYQIINNEVFHFDDKEEAISAIKERLLIENILNSES